MVTKYRSRKCWHNGIEFDSIAEMHRYIELSMAEKAGRITGLERQKAFILVPAVRLNGRMKPAVKYLADFTYVAADGSTVVEDVKSAYTAKLPVYRMKAHLMVHVHGIQIVEIK